jgi:hypothetical protein
MEVVLRHVPAAKRDEGVMRMTPPGYLLLVVLPTLAGSALGAQSPTMVTGTGSMQRKGAPMQEVRYRVPAKTASRQGFPMLLPMSWTIHHRFDVMTP